MEHKTSVTNTLSSIENESIEIRPFEIVNALKSVNKGKAFGVDGLVAEHYIYADERIHVIVSIIFNCFVSHGYLPSDFMKTAIVPIIKKKTGDTSDKNNYRPIARSLLVLIFFNYAFCPLLKISLVHTIISLVLRSSMRLICVFIQ